MDVSDGEESTEVRAASVSARHRDRDNCKPTKSAVKRNLPLLNLLSRVDEEERCNLLRHIDGEALNVICCCIFNAIWNRDIVPSSQRKDIKIKLKDSAKAIQYIARHKNNPSRRRRLLVQHSDSLPVLLSAVLPVIGSSSFGQSKKNKKRDKGEKVENKEKKKKKKKEKKNP